MQLKRILVSLLVAILMLSMAVIAVSAADTASATLDVAVTPNGVTADIDGNIPVTGDTLEIDVVIKNNPGVCFFSLDVVYDTAALEFDSNAVVKGDIYNITNVIPKNGVVTVFTDMMAVEDVTSTGVVITLKFKVVNSFTGENTKVSVKDIKAVNANFDVVSGSFSDAHHLDPANAQIVPPTCTEGGYTTIACSDEGCDFVKKFDEVPALKHKEETIPAVAATCTKTGLSEGKKCTVCGEVTVAPKEVAVIAHKEESIPAVAATCTTAGSTEGKKCTVCGTVTVEVKEVPVIAHKEESIPAVAATCTTAGSTEGKKCTVCGTVTVAATVVQPVAHTEEAIAAVAATCTTAGSTEGKKCTVCGAILVAPTVVQPAGHTLKDIAAVEPTYSEVGSTAGTECTVCGEIIDAPAEIPALSLAWLWILIGSVVVLGALIAVYFFVLRKKK